MHYGVCAEEPSRSFRGYERESRHEGPGSVAYATGLETPIPCQLIPTCSAEFPLAWQAQQQGLALAGVLPILERPGSP